jgi:hypothetical protein
MGGIEAEKPGVQGSKKNPACRDFVVANPACWVRMWA